MTDATASTEGAILELERIAGAGWQAPDNARLGEWHLRAGNGFTNRANSVLPLGSPGIAVAAALDTATDFYAARDLPTVFQIPVDQAGADLPVLAELTTELRRRGWIRISPTLVMTASIQAVAARCPVRRDLPAARLAASPDDAWLAGYDYRGGSLPPGATAVLQNADLPIFATVQDSDGLLGIARGVIVESWLGISGVAVPESRRRRGVGTHLLAELTRWAADRDVHSVYLQVEQTNEPALALYRGLGFSVHHGYCYSRR